MLLHVAVVAAVAAAVVGYPAVGSLQQEQKPRARQLIDAGEIVGLVDEAWCCWGRTSTTVPAPC